MSKLLLSDLKIVAWEITKNCNLSCVHCRAFADKKYYKGELSTNKSYKLMEQISEVGKPIIILTGGEPLLRRDVFDIALYGTNLGFRMVMAVNGTLIDETVSIKILDSGIKRISISLDGCNSVTHDKFRGVNGAFDETIKGINYLKKFNIDFQINTTVTGNNLLELSKIMNFVEDIGAVAHHIFLLVPTGRGKYIIDDSISKEEYENTLNRLYFRRKNSSIQIKVTCAPHYYRIMRQKASDEGRIVSYTEDGLDAFTRGCLAGISFCFISNTGIIQPCGYTSIDCGNVLENRFNTIWNNSKVFKELRNLKKLKGKCGKCNYIRVCGGCRARAFELTGDYMAEEPFCLYQPSGN